MLYARSLCEFTRAFIIDPVPIPVAQSYYIINIPRAIFAIVKINDGIQFTKDYAIFNINNSGKMHFPNYECMYKITLPALKYKSTALQDRNAIRLNYEGGTWKIINLIPEQRKRKWL